MRDGEVFDPYIEVSIKSRVISSQLSNSVKWWFVAFLLWRISLLQFPLKLCLGIPRVRWIVRSFPRFRSAHTASTCLPLSRHIAISAWNVPSGNLPWKRPGCRLFVVRSITFAYLLFWRPSGLSRKILIQERKLQSSAGPGHYISSAKNCPVLHKTL